MARWRRRTSNLETWLRCGITPARVIDNISVEFQLWLELDNPGDRFEVRFYNSNCAAANPATTFRGGYTWEGIANGVPNPNNEWRRYQIFYPGLRNPNTNETGLCIEFKFTKLKSVPMPLAGHNRR